jgi:xanthine dehydrogenase YagT iron-sulfur-binding subunit
MGDQGDGIRRDGGITRRRFIMSVGAASMAAAASGRVYAASEKRGPEVMQSTGNPETKIKLRINGRDRHLLVEPRWTLLHVLREELGLTGTKIGCGRGECGACTVLADGTPVYSCMTLAVEAEGTEITTLEGLMDGEKLGAVQEAFLEKDAYQCGYCTPGQIMAVEGLLRNNSDPTLRDVQVGVSGNLCRCGAYVNIFRAARSAAEKRK